MKTVTLLLFCLIALSGKGVAAEVPAFTAEGYPVPQPHAPLTFPEAHGSHPDFKIEWWYLTGHLFAADGRRFGYQATFFRSALKAPHEQTEDQPFGSAQLYLTHMALSDPGGKRFHFAERLSRGGWDAYARVGQLDVRNGNWSLSGATRTDPSMQLEASIDATVRWSLELVPDKPLIRFGEDGTSRKGPAPEARSYYLSFTRLATRGTLTIGEETFAVTGNSWMDHEIASNQLDPDYTGWDWIAIQLEDGWEVKAYLLRQSDGKPAPFSALIWISPGGAVTYRGPDSFTWKSARTWTSPDTEATYPIAPVITSRHPESGEPVTFRFDPVLDNQELDLPGTTYWEGAGRVLDAENREVGSAYLELVGYAGPIEGLR
jgi:predicted secreted hydrolase